MNRIVVIYDKLEPPVEITKRLFDGFCEIYDCDVAFYDSSVLDSSILNTCTLLIELRPQSIFLSRIASIVSRSGRVVAVMYDDDFLAIKDYHTRRPIQEKAIIRTLNNSDVLMCTNDSLLEKYRTLGKIKRFIRTDTVVYDRDIFKPSIHAFKYKEDVLRIVYYCNDGSTGVFDEVIGKILPQIVERFGDIIEWTFIGTKPVIDNCVRRDHIRYIGHLNLEGFRKELREGGYSYGIAPLLGDEFSGHKYINKYMEFSTAGIACVFSDVPPYKGFVNDKIDGVLCDNSASGWINAMEYMNNVDNRLKMVNNAQKRLKNEFSLESISRRIVDTIPEILKGSTEKERRISRFSIELARIEERIYRCMDPVYRAIGRLKLEGLGSLIRYSIGKMVRR